MSYVKLKVKNTIFSAMIFFLSQELGLSQEYMGCARFAEILLACASQEFVYCHSCLFFFLVTDNERPCFCYFYQ